MVSCFHFQNKVLNIDGVKVKLQVRIFPRNHQTTEYKRCRLTPEALQPILFPTASLSEIKPSLALAVPAF